ncbi:MAG: SulP family inorganic anion transporter [Chitinophagaceae bacterium]
MSNHSIKTQPLDGLRGLKQHALPDAISGFIVFLLALPLSLGIAKASEFPPLMGIITAIIGGIVVSFFAGSPLTIKGPAAGLIVICVGAVTDFGGGELGWHITLGAIFVAALVQIVFGLLKWGRFVDVFPLSAVHGMLAAIGLIIILKQFPVLLDVDPALAKGKSPFQLIAAIPHFIQHMDWRATGVGLVSLAIMLFWQKMPIAFLRKLPAALVVLMFAIPAELILNFQETEPKYALVHIGSLMENIKWQIQFDGIHHVGTFIKYVIMFALIGSLESLLTVKAIDLMDPHQRKSNPNRDLLAVGIGNTIASLLGGLPMISEVARSSANVNNGAQTRWANFFHGLFLLGFVLLATPFIEMIPNTALAAMLISVGIKLAHPREFVHVFEIGKEQLAIFLVTIFFTLFEDLLVGIAAGMVLKMIIHIINGASLKSFFSVGVSVSFNDTDYLVTVKDAAMFTNYLKLKSKLDAIPAAMNIVVNFTETQLVDHSVMENLHQFEKNYIRHGGTFVIQGIDEHEPVSNHRLAARKKKAGSVSAGILFLLLSIGFAKEAQAQRVHANQTHAWFAYTSQIKLNQHLGVHLEGQWRREDMGLKPQQLLLRGGLMYTIMPNLQATIGYAFVQTSPYGAFPVKCAFAENRFWQQLQTKNSYKVWDTWLRLRLEQRFSNLPVATASGYEPGDAVYTNRMRIMNRWNRPIWKTSNKEHTLYASVYDELFINFGKKVANNLLDQNRLGGMLGFTLTPKTNIEFGYLLQTVIKSSGLQVENNHTLNLSVFTNLDWSNPKK